jgi:hypothetical protein
MAFRIPFSLVLAAPMLLSAATAPPAPADDAAPRVYKAFPDRELAAACTDCGSITEVEHEFGDRASFLVHVTMDDGRELVVRRQSAEDLAIGSRVHLNEGRVRRF